MTSKRLKEPNEIHDKVINKDFFSDVFNLLMIIENSMKKWVKIVET